LCFSFNNDKDTGRGEGGDFFRRLFIGRKVDWISNITYRGWIHHRGIIDSINFSFFTGTIARILL
jgi:hypothetical protein